MLPDPVPRDGERALARFGLLGEGAAPVFTPGARYPLAGLLLALPALAQTGLLDCARQVYGRLRDGFYGLDAMLVHAGVPGAAARAPRRGRHPGPAGRRWAGCWAWTGRRRSRRSAASSASSPPPARPRTCSMAMARHHAAARPDTLGFLYIDGHTRAYFGTRDVQKMHVARLKFPGPATEETWVTDSAGDPLLVVMAEPSSSLAAQIRDAAARAARHRRARTAKPTLCFDRGGWSPALFADITAAGFDLLTYRKAPGKDIPDLPADAFTTVTCDRRRRPRAPSTTWPTPAIELTITDGPHKGRRADAAAGHPPGQAGEPGRSTS